MPRLFPHQQPTAQGAHVWGHWGHLNQYFEWWLDGLMSHLLEAGASTRQSMLAKQMWNRNCTQSPTRCECADGNTACVLRRSADHVVQHPQTLFFKKLVPLEKPFVCVCCLVPKECREVLPGRCWKQTCAPDCEGDVLAVIRPLNKVVPAALWNTMYACLQACWGRYHQIVCHIYNCYPYM